MKSSGVSFEKETEALTKRVLDFFERIRYAYLSAKENPKEYGKKWSSTVKSIRENFDGLGKFAELLKDKISEKDLFDDRATNPDSAVAKKVYEDVKRMRFETSEISDPFSKQLGDKVLETLLEDEAVFASFIHYALRSHANTLPKKAWEEAKLKPDEITQNSIGLDIEVKDIPLYIIEHYGDDKDTKRVKGKFDKALALLKEVYQSRYSEERWNNLKDLDIAKSDEEKADVDFLVPNKPMYRIFELDDMKEILGLSGEYVVQEKYDGMRVQIHKFNNKIKIYSYNEKDITDKCPEQVEKMENKAFGDCILDGELMLFDGDEALHRADTITHVFKKKLDGGKLRLHVFDIMRHEGRDLVDEPLRERINILLYQFSQHSSEPLAFPSKKDTRIADSMKEVGEYAEKIMDMPTAEGVVIKDIESTYYIGKRKNPKWIKWKKFVDLDVIVLDMKKTGSGMFSYTMGAGPLTAEEKRDMKSVEYSGKDYAPVGKALNTKIEVDVGSIIRVKVDEVNKKKGGFSLYSAKLIELPEVDEPDKIRTLEQLSSKTKKSLSGLLEPVTTPKSLINPLAVVAELQAKDSKKVKKYTVTDYIHGEAEIIFKSDVDGFTVYGLKGDTLMEKNAIVNMDEMRDQLSKFIKSRKSKLRVMIRNIIDDNDSPMTFDEIEEKLRAEESDAYDEVFSLQPRELLNWMKRQDSFIELSGNKFDNSPETIQKDREESEMAGRFEVRQRDDGNIDFIIETDKDRMAWLIDIDEPTDIYELFGKSGKYPAMVSERIDSTKVLDSGELIFGVQRHGYHEYRMEGDKFQSRIHFRVVPLNEKKSWIVFTGKQQEMLDKEGEDEIIDIQRDKYRNLELPDVSSPEDE